MIFKKIRNEVHNFLTGPSIFHNSKIINSSAKKAADEIKLKGYYSFGKVLSNEQISIIRKAIDESIKKGLSEYNESNLYYLISNPLLIKEIRDIACKNDFIEIAKSYFKNSVFLADVDSRRIPPVSMIDVEKNGLSSSNWHRDARGRQVKVMIYLTDVTESDSNFSFYPGTHNVISESFSENRFKDNEIEGEPIEWYGKAGEAMIFDTNLIHRLRRKVNGDLRDSVTFYITPGLYLRKFEINEIGLDKFKLRYLKGAPFWSKRS
jgi:ectoine hydroxylase-related dioxygenase (phytanoyl-CoA dioxygenase family)